MPIVQLQSEFAAALSIAPPEYTWATKPAAAGNAGKEIIVSDMHNSEWYSDGTYWRPKNGRAVLFHRDLTSISGAFSTTGAVAAAGTFTMSSDLANIPAVRFRTEVAAARNNLVGTQAALLGVGDSPTNFFALSYSQASGSASVRVVRTSGEFNRNVVESFVTTAQNSTNLFSEQAATAYSLSSVQNAVLSLYARNGSTDSSETWAFYYWRMEVLA